MVLGRPAGPTPPFPSVARRSRAGVAGFVTDTSIKVLEGRFSSVHALGHVATAGGLGGDGPPAAKGRREKDEGNEAQRAAERFRRPSLIRRRGTAMMSLPAGFAGSDRPTSLPRRNRISKIGRRFWSSGGVVATLDVTE
jgi:hypothetical protein